MIDTVVLNIPLNQKGIIQRPGYFKPPLKIYKSQAAQKCKSYIKATQNPLKKDLLKGIYKPRLTFYGRPSPQGRFLKYFLKIEFSAPKLLFGNNFDELEESDFSSVIRNLATTLQTMGVYISEYELMNAPVSAIHYSKNIPLDDGTSVTMILDELKKVDLNGRLDLTQTDFRFGHALRYHADTFDVVFYNKLEELRKAKISSKRPIEKDNEIQLNLFAPLNKIRLEVFRMEVRLGKKKKIEQILKKIGKPVGIIFKNLFKKDIAQKLLLSYWNEIDQGLFLPPAAGTEPIDFLNLIKQANSNLNPDKILKMVGALMLLQNLGVRQFRACLGFVGSRSPPWYRLKKELKPFNGSKTYSGYKALLHIPNALNAFQMVKLANFNIQI